MSTPSSTNTTAFNGCSAASTSSTCSARCSHAGVVGEERDEPRPHAARAPRRSRPRRRRPTRASAEPRRAPCAGRRRRGTRPTIACPAIASASSDEREEQEHLERDLVRGDGVVADAGRDRGGGEERGEERAGADHQPAADLGVRADAGGVAAAATRPRDAGRPHDDHEERERGGPLRDHRAPRRSRDAEVERVDEAAARAARLSTLAPTAITSVVRVSCRPREVAGARRGPRAAPGCPSRLMRR